MWSNFRAKQIQSSTAKEADDYTRRTTASGKWLLPSWLFSFFKHLDGSHRSRSGNEAKAEGNLLISGIFEASDGHSGRNRALLFLPLEIFVFDRDNGTAMNTKVLNMAINIDFFTDKLTIQIWRANSSLFLTFSLFQLLLYRLLRLIITIFRFFVSQILSVRSILQ